MANKSVIEPVESAGRGFLEYAPAPESTSILHLKKSYGLFIDGDWVDGHGQSFSTISPATEKKIATIASAMARSASRWSNTPTAAAPSSERIMLARTPSGGSR